MALNCQFDQPNLSNPMILDDHDDTANHNHVPRELSRHRFSVIANEVGFFLYVVLDQRQVHATTIEVLLRRGPEKEPSVKTNDRDFMVSR